MAASLATPNTFPSVISKAVEESAAAFFSGSCGLTHVPEAPPRQDDPTAGIMSTISFLGSPPWSFALAFPEDGAVKIAKAFAGFDIPFDSPDMGDVVGEIVNVIAGDISGRLGKKGIAAQMSLPTTVSGDNVAVLVPSGATTARFTFSGPAGTCWFNLICTNSDSSSVAAAEAPPPDSSGTSRSKPAASEEAFTAAPQSEAMAAWAAAEAAAERELAEQDAAEAAQRAAGGGRPTNQPVTTIARPIERVRAPSRRLLYLTIVFACGGWGAMAGVLVARTHHAPNESAPPGAHANESGTVPENSVAHIDALIRSGRFAEALQQCLDAPKKAPGGSETALALREGLCLEGTGHWWEASKAYQKAEADPSVVASTIALLGQARCAAHEGSYTLARVLTKRALFRSGHPDCRGLGVREEVRYLRSQIADLESGAAPLHAGPPAPQPLSTSACNCLDWLAGTPVSPAPVPGRDVLEVHRALEDPGALQVTVRFAPRATIAVIRALGSTAGWKVQASDQVIALLNLPVSSLDVDHMPLPEFLGTLIEGTGVTWTIQEDALVLTQQGRGQAAFRSE